MAQPAASLISAEPAQGVAPSPPEPAAAPRPRRNTAPMPVATPADAGPGLVLPQPHGRGPARALPGTPTFIPITPRPRLVIAGAVLIIIGMWALLSFLPSNKPAPWDPRNPSMQPASGMSDEAYYAGNVIAFALIIIGGSLAITQALHKAQTEVLCRICHKQVIGWKDSFGLLCPLDKHHARVDWLVLVATVGFWVMTVIMLLVLAVIVIA